MSSPAIWDASKASASWESELAAWDCITDLIWVLKAFLILFVYLAIVGACTHCCSLGWAAHHCYKACRRNTDHCRAPQQEGQQSPRSSSPPSAREHNRQASKVVTRRYSTSSLPSTSTSNSSSTKDAPRAGGKSQRTYVKSPPRMAALGVPLSGLKLQTPAIRSVHVSGTSQATLGVPLLPIIRAPAPTCMNLEPLGRQDLPQLPPTARSRGSIDKALAIAANARALSAATDALREGFFANSSRLGKASKRMRAEELAAIMAGIDDLYPLTAPHDRWRGRST